VLKLSCSKRFLVWVFLALSGYIAFIYLSVGALMKIPSHQITQIFAKTKTLYIGRFLLDVPFSVEVVYGPADVRLQTERYPGKAADIDLVVKKA
jgi:hypothetical protein